MSPQGTNKPGNSGTGKGKVDPKPNGRTDQDLLIAPSPALLSKLYRIRKWGDPVMLKLGFDVNQVNTTNFQATGLYNKETGFGAVTNFLYIPREEVFRVRDMQFDQAVDGKNASKVGKMNWLCGFRGKIYMYDDPSHDWQTADRVRWGTVALGGNLVQVDGFEEIHVKLPGENEAAVHTMARLVGFRKTDWARPLADLLAEGLVHRCYCAYKDNRFGDSPKGIVYSPFFSPLDWDFSGNRQPGAFYIPTKYLEPKETVNQPAAIKDLPYPPSNTRRTN